MISFLHLLSVLLLMQPTVWLAFIASKADCWFVLILLFTGTPTDPFLQSCSVTSQPTACTNAWGYSVPRAGLWSGSCQPVTLASWDPCNCSPYLLSRVNLHSDTSYKCFMKMFNSFGPGLDVQGMALIADWQTSKCWLLLSLKASTSGSFLCTLYVDNQILFSLPFPPRPLSVWVQGCCIIFFSMFQ